MFTRRQWLNQTGAGFGSIALASLLRRDGYGADRSSSPLVAAMPHYTPRIRSVIFLFMYGGPSHIDLFDPKPTLAKYDGQPIPVFKQDDVFMSGKTKNIAMKSPYKFSRFGQSGIEISETYPELAKHADKLCVIRSMHCESNNHGPAIFQMNSGSILAGKPSMGSWLTYGLGTEGENLPGYVVMLDYQGAPINGAMNWSNGFMPAAYQGVPFRPSGEPIAYLSPPQGVNRGRQSARLELLRQWNEGHAAANPADSALAARIASYELAFRMQTHATEAVDLASESAEIQNLYGLDHKTSHHFGRNCLLARRLVERGVRFIQLYSGGNEGPKAWDAHDDLKKNHDLHCAETDRPIAGLLTDLKNRGLLESTLVIWGGEFGRTPTAESGKGRDHHARGFTMWLAGGGIRGGTVYGATDELGYHAVENVVDVHDLHATILALMGIDHHRLTTKFQGLDVRLTGIAGKVVEGLMA